MDYNQPQTPVSADGRNSSFATASLFLGIVALATFCICFISTPLAGLSILFALLSSRRNLPMLRPAKIGITLSCIALAISAILLILVICMAVGDPSFRQAFWESFQESYNAAYSNGYL